jgi:hypothetical protein
MSDKHEHLEPGQKEAQLSEEELGDVFGGRMLRIASFYLRNHVKREASLDQDVQVNPDK